MNQFVAVVVAFIATRLVRGWNQTGQKFAGEPDIVKIFLQPQPVIIWVLVTVTYIWVQRELVRGFDALPTALSGIANTTLVLAAFTFKLAFTNEDAPELVVGFARSLVEITQGASLVTRARVVFIGLAIDTACVVYFMITRSRISKKASGKLKSLLHPCQNFNNYLSYRDTASPLYSTSHDAISGYQHSPIPALRYSVQVPCRSGPQLSSAKHIIPLATVHVLLRFWRYKCHLICRPIKRLQRRERL